MTLPMGIVAPVALHAYNVIRYAAAGNIAQAQYEAIGVNASGDIVAGKVKDIVLPYVVGAAIHIGAKYLGINKALGRARVPIFRL